MKRHLIAMSTLLVVACGEAPELDEVGAPAPVVGQVRDAAKASAVAKVQLRAASERSTSPVFKTSFSAATTYELYFASDVGGLRGKHRLAIELLMPNGLPYQRLEVAFATDTAAGTGEVQAEKLSTGYRVWTSIPVAGTAIEQYQLTGTWNAKLTLDSSATPNAALAFALTP